MPPEDPSITLARYEAQLASAEADAEDAATTLAPIKDAYDTFMAENKDSLWFGKKVLAAKDRVNDAFREAQSASDDAGREKANERWIIATADLQPILARAEELGAQIRPIEIALQPAKEEVLRANALVTATRATIAGALPGLKAAKIKYEEAKERTAEQTAHREARAAAEAAANTKANANRRAPISQLNPTPEEAEAVLAYLYPKEKYTKNLLLAMKAINRFATEHGITPAQAEIVLRDLSP